MKIEERVAAGLRRMQIKPDYLLFFDAWDETCLFEEPTCCGIPVVHVPELTARISSYAEECPFYPGFKIVVKETVHAGYDFCRGYGGGYVE